MRIFGFMNKCELNRIKHLFNQKDDFTLSSTFLSEYRCESGKPSINGGSPRTTTTSALRFYAISFRKIYLTKDNKRIIKFHFLHLLKTCLLLCFLVFLHIFIQIFYNDNVLMFMRQIGLNKIFDIFSFLSLLLK